jgi:putative membrane protein
MIRDPVKATMFIAVVAGLGLSLIRAPYPEFHGLQHTPTVPALILIVAWDRRWPMSRSALGCLLWMLALHILGARYIYSMVPYDGWSESIAGVRLSEVFGFERNHYDRLVHLLFGALLVLPIREFLERERAYSRRGGVAIAILVVMAASLLYEVAEWLIAVTISPEDAEAYNGQQGDFWDAQKDMALATAGAVVAGAFQLRTPRSTALADGR